MKYLFTLLATCFVLGLSAQSSDSATKMINDQIEFVKQDLASHNNMLSKNEELTTEDKTRLSDVLTLSKDQITVLKKELMVNAKAIATLTSSDVAPLEMKERLSGLEGQRDNIIYQALSPQQQNAFKASQRRK